MGNRSSRSRLKGSVGATLVEYSLIIALVSVPSIGAMNFLTKQANKETNNQADCISTRPPPPSCQVRPVTTTTSTLVIATSTSSTASTTTTSTAPPSSTTTSTAPPSTTTTSIGTPTTIAQSPVVDWPRGNWSKPWGGNWTYTGTVTVAAPDGTPAVGATVSFYFDARWTSNGRNRKSDGPGTCVTDASGTCTVTWESTTNRSSRPAFTATITSVNSTPAPSSLPPAQTWTAG